MSVKAVRPRRSAIDDVERAIDYYLGEGSIDAASGFVDALEGAYSEIGRHPSIGSQRYAVELNLPELRHWALTKYPCLVFYVDRADHIDVWRVLHQHRNIPASMQDGAG